MALRIEKCAATFFTALAITIAVLTVQIGEAQAQNPELGDESDVGVGGSAGASWSTGTQGQATGTASTTGTTGTTGTTAPAYEEEETNSAPAYSGDSDHSAMTRTI